MSKLQMKKRFSSILVCLEDFLTTRIAEGVTDKTVQSYRNMFHAIGKHIDLEMGIDELTKQDLLQLVCSLKERGLSENTISGYTRHLHSFLTWANEEGLTDVNIKVYKTVETVKETYNDEELRKLLRKPNMRTVKFFDYRNWVIINLLVNSGCRASTIRNILIVDVGLDKGLITYRHNKNRKIQIVPLCDEMRRILRDYMRIRDGADNDFLFPSEQNKQMTERGFQQAVARYNKSRGVSKTSVHLFRHTFAERFLLAGGNAFTLQRILGHSTLDMTKRYCRIYDNNIVENFNQYSPLSQLNK